MIPEVEAVPKVDTFVAVAFVVRSQGRQDSQLNSRCVTILLDRAYDFNCTASLALLVIGFDNFAKRALP